MARRKRREADPEEFQDPLSNYDTPEYEDELDRSLAEDTVTAVIRTQPFKAISPETSVEEAMRLMHELGIACLVVADASGKLAGVFSERDVLARVAEQFEAVRGERIDALMTADPAVVYETDCPAKAVNLLATGGFRHIPVVDVDGRVVGILGPRRITRYLSQLMEQEADG